MRRVLCVFGALVVAPVLVASASSAPGPQLSAQDVNYLQTSISGDRFEIIGGNHALAKGTTAQVKALGRRLIKDHAKSLKESLAEAKTYGVKAPQSPTPTMVWELNTVAALSGTAFDKAYTSLEIKDHQQDIEETTFETQHGGNPEIKNSAKKELPMLRVHLALSIKASQSA